MPEKRYSPTSVSRYYLKCGDWELVDKYEDATVRDQGEHGFIRAPEAMLRAYRNDIDFLETDYPEEYRFDKKEGFLLDVDRDIALKRIIGYVISKHSFGHGKEEWNMIVCQNEDGRWDGWGFNDGDNNMRFERWCVEIFKPD